MTTDQFVSKYLGKKIDWDGYYGGQCVDLFRQYVQEVLVFPQPKGVNGAADFWTNYSTDPALRDNYEKIANSPQGIPQKGDVVIWNKNAGGGFGHVAVFLEGSVNAFVSFDQNWPTLNVCTKTSHNYTNVLGWFRPKKAVTGAISVSKEDFERLMRKSLTYDALCEYLKVDTNTTTFDKIKDAFEKLKSDLQDSQSSKNDLEGEISQLETEVQRIGAERDKAVSNVCPNPDAHASDNSGDNQPPVSSPPSDSDSGASNPPAVGQKNPIEALINFIVNWIRG